MTHDYSLRRLLVVAMSLVFLLGLGSGLVYYYFEAYDVGEHLDERTLQSQARELLAALKISKAGEVAFALPRIEQELYSSADSTSYYALYDRAQSLVASSPNLPSGLPFIAAPAPGRFSDLSFVAAEPGRVAALAVGTPGGHTLVVGRSKPDEDALAFTLIEEGSEGFLIVLVPFVLISLLIIWLITDRSLRPVARAAQEAQAIGPGNASARIATRGLPAEIRPLADAANGAVERLARAYTAEKRLTADAAHELRTPLAVLNLRLQQAKIRNVVDWPQIEREIATLNKLVNQLLDLARKESAEHAPDEIRIAPVNLSRVVREAAATVLPLAEEAGRSIEIDVPDNFMMRGHADDLRDMVRNLLENAVFHGRGVVRVSVRAAGDRGHGVAIEVQDEGVAILGDELFSRFRKGNPASSGTGLGLAIVRQVARNHGGDASFVPGGAGSRVRVYLPTA